MTQDTNTASGAATREIEDCPELNLSNYSSDDVDRLNDWAIRADEEIDRLRAALASAPAQPVAEPAQPIGYLNPKVLGTDGKIDAHGVLTYSSRPCGSWTFPFYAAAPTAPADSVQEDAARYRHLRDGEWRDTDLEPFIRLQLNTMWDAKIDAARKQEPDGSLPCGH